MLFYLFALVQALLLLSQMSPEIAGEKIEINRLYEAVDFLLPFQVQTHIHTTLIFLNLRFS